MEYRRLGHSGFKVPVLTLGTAGFADNAERFKGWSQTNVQEATRMVDICLEAGVNMFDTADTYSSGDSERVLGQAIAGRRDKLIISTKATFRSGPGPNDVGSSRHHLTDAVHQALLRLNTDYIDLFQLHSFDAMTPVEETLRTLDDMIRAGKIRYIGCSNFAGWQLMKSLGTSERLGLSRHIAHQAHYSLISREYEWELMPLAIDQGVGTIVWSPLGWARLTGKIRRGQPIPETSRHNTQAGKNYGQKVPDEYLFKVIDAIDEVAAETGKTVPQIALNWLLSRPTVSSLIIGARNEDQLRQNLGSVGWSLTEEQIRKLDDASAVLRIYPHWHQASFTERNPFPTR